MSSFPKPATHIRIAFFALLWAACPEPTKPTAGDLVVRLSTPNSDDRAVQLTIQCPQRPGTVIIESGYWGYSDLSGNTTALIVIRQGGLYIPSTAEVARIPVEDVDKTCTASPTSVAFQGYGERTSLAGYSVTVAKP